MIEVICDNQGERREYFELLRVLFPEYEISLDLIIRLIAEQEILLEFNNDRFHLTNINYSSIKERKRSIKREIFDILSSYTKNNSWGILIGIRPGKLALGLLNNLGYDKAYKTLIIDYRLSSQSAKLLLDIADVQRNIFSKIKTPSYSLYIHIPFCPSICSYCSFHTISNSKKDLIREYVYRLLDEIELISSNMETSPTTIYIGGGTPTSIGIKELETILKSINDKFKIPNEFTVECGRPDTINKEILNLLNEYKVNRISINPQTMNDKSLRLIGRSHSSTDIINAFKLARNFKNFVINADLILGLPGESLEDIKYSLNEVVNLNPENITIHTLSIKSGSKLMDNNYNDFNNNINEGLDYIKNKLKINEYFPYYMYRQKRILGNGENIGYSKLDNESIYNIAIMEERQSIIGLGMGSTTKFYNSKNEKVEKYFNYKNMRDYLHKEYKFLNEKLNHIKNLKL